MRIICSSEICIVEIWIEQPRLGEVSDLLGIQLGRENMGFILTLDYRLLPNHPPIGFGYSPT